MEEAGYNKWDTGFANCSIEKARCEMRDGSIAHCSLAKEICGMSDTEYGNCCEDFSHGSFAKLKYATMYSSFCILHSVFCILHSLFYIVWSVRKTGSYKNIDFKLAR